MTNTQSSQIDADREAYRRYYDSGVSALLSEIFGGNIHMGLFAEPDEPLWQAQERLKDYIAVSAGLKASQSVFEAACGVGTTALHLARVYGVHVHATNIAEAQLAEAWDRARQAGLSDQVNFPLPTITALAAHLACMTAGGVRKHCYMRATVSRSSRKRGAW